MKTAFEAPRLSQEQLRDIGLVLRGAAAEWTEAQDVGRLYGTLTAILDVLTKAEVAP